MKKIIFLISVAIAFLLGCVESPAERARKEQEKAQAELKARRESLLNKQRQDLLGTLKLKFPIDSVPYDPGKYVVNPYDKEMMALYSLLVTYSDPAERTITQVFTGGGEVSTKQDVLFAINFAKDVALVNQIKRLIGVVSADSTLMAGTLFQFEEDKETGRLLNMLNENFSTEEKVWLAAIGGNKVSYSRENFDEQNLMRLIVKKLSLQKDLKRLEKELKKQQNAQEKGKEQYRYV